jgi:hypothetical protein
MKNLIFTLLMLSATIAYSGNGQDDIIKTFNFTTIDLDTSGSLNFQTVHENKRELLYVEQYMWDNWKVVGEMESDGLDTNNYSFKVETLHSGLNRFRIRKESSRSLNKYSESVSYKSKVDKVYHFKKGSKILLSKRVDYLLYDENGVLLEEETGSVINVAKLLNGKYTLCFDNTKVEFKKSIIPTRFSF